MKTTKTKRRSKRTSRAPQHLVPHVSSTLVLFIYISATTVAGCCEHLFKSPLLQSQSVQFFVFKAFADFDADDDDNGDTAASIAGAKEAYGRIQNRIFLNNFLSRTSQGGMVGGSRELTSSDDESELEEQRRTRNPMFPQLWNWLFYWLFRTSYINFMLIYANFFCIGQIFYQTLPFYAK